LAALWSKREADLERARDLRRRDPGVIRQWLVVAPITFSLTSSGLARDTLAALDQQQLLREAELRPVAGEPAQVADSELIWRHIQLDDYMIDFQSLAGETSINSGVLGRSLDSSGVAYAVCYIKSDADQTGVVMHVGSDDQAKVYLNGKEVYRWPDARAFVPDHNATVVDLNAGLNVVVFKVVNGLGTWKGSIRFSNRDGKPLDGIRVVLDPGEGDVSD
jgi:hypothetical protein